MLILALRNRGVGEDRQVWEFKASLLYTESSRLAGAKKHILLFQREDPASGSGG